MAKELEVVGIHTPGGMQLLQGGRPLIVNEGPRKTQAKAFPQIVTSRGLKVNSLLIREEWERIDNRVMQAVLQPMNLTRQLVSRGLTTTLGSIGVLQASYTRVGEMTPATASLRAHASTEKDLVNFDLVGTPVPVISKEFELDIRTLAASRLMGNELDTANAMAAARVVGEKVEDLVINGDTSINLNGNTIYGLTTHPNRNTDTATNLGGGDWGTITNVLPTLAGAIGALQADGFYGPYGIFAHTVQYNQAALAFFTDGTAASPRDRALTMPGVEFFEPSAQLDAGEVIVVHLSSEVIEIAYVDQYWPTTDIEWTSGDGMQVMFKVMTVATPLVKASQGNQSGVFHITAA